MITLSRSFSWYAMAPLLVILGSAAVSALAASAQNQGNQTDAVQVLSNMGTFSVENTVVGVVAANQNESSSHCLAWGSSECIAQGGLSGGDWFLMVELRLDALPEPPYVYDVSVQVYSADLPLQPIEFAVTNSTVPGSVGNFCWDLGSSFTTPLAYTVTVADA